MLNFRHLWKEHILEGKRARSGTTAICLNNKEKEESPIHYSSVSRLRFLRGPRLPAVDLEAVVKTAALTEADKHENGPKAGCCEV